MQGKFTAHIRLAFQRHISSMDPGNLLYHGQAQTCAAFVAVGSVHLIKPLPYFILLLRRDTDPVIPDPQKDFILTCTRRYPDTAAGLTIFKFYPMFLLCVTRCSCICWRCNRSI